MRLLIGWMLCGALTIGVSSSVLAKGPTPQNHHCMKDGAELAGKTRKQCKKEGGKWDKMETAGKSDEKPMPGPAPKP